MENITYRGLYSLTINAALGDIGNYIFSTFLELHRPEFTETRFNKKRIFFVVENMISHSIFFLLGHHIEENSSVSKFVRNVLHGLS